MSLPVTLGLAGTGTDTCWRSVPPNSAEYVQRNTTATKGLFLLGKNRSFVLIARLCTSLWIKVPLQAAAPRCTRAGQPARGWELVHSTISSRGAEITTQDPNLAAHIFVSCLGTGVRYSVALANQWETQTHYGGCEPSRVNRRLADCRRDKLTRQMRPMRDWVMGLWPTSEAFSRKKK